MRIASALASVVWLTAALLPTQPAHVSVFATVTDAQRRLVTDLDAAAFQVKSDDAICEIDRVAPPSHTAPVAIVLLVDGSASVRRYAKTADVVKGAADVLSSALGPDDRVSAGRVAASQSLRPLPVSGTTLLEALTTATATPYDESYGPSPLWDAIDLAISDLQTAPGRRAIVAFTDGRSTGNLRGTDEVADRAALSDVALYFVGSDFPSSRFGNYPAVSPMQQAADHTGGGVLPMFVQLRYSTALNYIPRPDPAAAVRRIISDLRSTFRIDFVPPKSDGARHTLHVSVTIPGLDVRARRAYVAPSAQ